MNIVLKYNEVKELYEALGSEGFLCFFSDQYSQFDLYCFSLDWLFDKKYVLKFKGCLGDLVVCLV